MKAKNKKLFGFCIWSIVLAIISFVFGMNINTSHIIIDDPTPEQCLSIFVEQYEKLGC